MDSTDRAPRRRERSSSLFAHTTMGRDPSRQADTEMRWSRLSQHSSPRAKMAIFYNFYRGGSAWTVVTGTWHAVVCASRSTDLLGGTFSLADATPIAPTATRRSLSRDAFRERRASRVRGTPLRATRRARRTVRTRRHSPTVATCSNGAWLGNVWNLFAVSHRLRAWSCTRGPFSFLYTAVSWTVIVRVRLDYVSRRRWRTRVLDT